MASKIALIIDDEPDIATYHATLLEDNGWSVRTELSGDEGIAAAKREKPDVVLLDVMMPERGGLSTLVGFRKDPEQGASRAPAAKTRQKPAAAEAEPARALFECLREVRRGISQDLGIPPYCIFHDKTLREMAALKPVTREQLLCITGVGDKKLERFGEAFLKAIRDGGT